MTDDPSVPPEAPTASSAPTGPIGLGTAVGELEAHAASQGWDQPARLFALVDTRDLLRREPGLADALGLDGEPAEDSLTPVEQEVATDEQLEDLLARIVWPAEVAGCAAVVERVVLPPSADTELPDDGAEAAAYASHHPDRQEVRIVAGATRDGATYCALRLRAHDDAGSVLTGPDLVPGLLELLQGTLLEEEQDDE
ncbi:MAG: PPA1309 family protein [Nocardioidaceae bacterium]